MSTAEGKGSDPTPAPTKPTIPFCSTCHQPIESFSIRLENSFSWDEELGRYTPDSLVPDQGTTLCGECQNQIGADEEDALKELMED